MEHITTKEELVKLLEANDKVIVDFYATWCGPCKMLAPVLEQVANEVNDVLIVKVDTDQAQELAYEFNVMSIPTLVFFKNKNKVAVEIGFQGKANILENINNYLR